jgi:predicted glutamine amidotransferase
MCRVLGCVASEPISLRHELLYAANPFIHQSQDHDSGWGIAVYPRGEGEEPRCERFPTAAHADGDFHRATDLRGRIINAHVRRATIGGLTLENTHPFCLGEYSFSHNGTIINARALLGSAVSKPVGQTDSEHFFNLVMSDFDSSDVPDSLRRAVATAVRRSPFSGLNFLFSDGERLYAYRLGIFELHWLARPGQLVVASEIVTPDERWHTVQQDVLLTLDPADADSPHAERLIGSELVAGAEVRKFEEGAELRGHERGAFAAKRAARLAAEPSHG